MAGGGGEGSNRLTMRDTNTEVNKLQGKLGVGGEWLWIIGSKCCSRTYDVHVESGG